MARQKRIDLGNYVYHVINRANARARIFHTKEDYLDFEYLLNEMCELHDMRILAYVVMPNHWHMLLYPKGNGDLSKALQWLGTAHAVRYHRRKDTIGGGHLYQGRYKSFLVQTDNHLLTVLKYIERNPVRAKLSARTEDWRWGSAYRRISGTTKEKKLLAESPTVIPKTYIQWINTPEPAEVLEKVRHSVNRGVAYGDALK